VLPYRLFAHAYALEEVKIPDSVRVIEDEAFNCCQNLRSIDLPAGLTQLGDYAFGGVCYWVQSVVIPEGITAIGENTFGSCDVLTTVTIPASVTSIHPLAFEYSSNLKTIRGKAGSYAQQFAAENNLEFIAE
jgi:hypothetical protein